MPSIVTTSALPALVALGLAYGVAVPPPAAAQGQPIEVLDRMFARSVENREPRGVVANGSPARPLFFWMMFEADRSVAADINAAGRLPMIHRWTHYDGGGATMSVEIPVGSIPKELIGRLGSPDRFLWRTWSNKAVIAPGLWTVEVLYKNLPLACGAEPCKFAIELK